MRSTPPAEADRSIPELLQKLASETTQLVRQELRLARAEVMEAVDDAKPAATAFGLSRRWRWGRSARLPHCSSSPWAWSCRCGPQR